MTKPSPYVPAYKAMRIRVPGRLANALRIEWRAAKLANYIELPETLEEYIIEEICNLPDRLQDAQRKGRSGGEE